MRIKASGDHAHNPGNAAAVYDCLIKQERAEGRATVNHIAQHCHLSKSTVFHHFRNLVKKNLIFKIGEQTKSGYESLEMRQRKEGNMNQSIANLFDEGRQKEVITERIEACERIGAGCVNMLSNLCGLIKGNVDIFIEDSKRFYPKQNASGGAEFEHGRLTAALDNLEELKETFSRIRDELDSFQKRTCR